MSLNFAVTTPHNEVEEKLSQDALGVQPRGIQANFQHGGLSDDGSARLEFSLSRGVVFDTSQRRGCCQVDVIFACGCGRSNGKTCEFDSDAS